MADIRITYVADVAKALQGMESVETATKKQIAEVTRATAALRAYDGAQAALVPGSAKLSRGMGTATATTAKLTEAQQQSRQVMRNLGYQIGDVANSIAAGQPVWQSVGRQVLDVAGQFNIATVAAKALAVVSSPLTLAVAAIGTAAIVVANHTQEARLELARYQAVIESTDTASRRLISSQNALRLASGDVAGFVGDLQIQTALLRGEISKADVEAGTLGNTFADKLGPRLVTAKAEFVRNEVAITQLRAAMKSGKLDSEELAAANVRLSAALDARAGLAANVKAVQAEMQTGREAIGEYAGALEEAAAATKDAKTGAAEYKNELRDQAEYIRAVAASEDERQKDLKESFANRAKVAKTEADEFRAIYEERKRLSAQEREDAKQALIATQMQTEAGIAATADVLAANSNAIGALAEMTASRSTTAARGMFEASKAAAIASATINTYVGATKAVAELGPFGIPVAAGIVTAGLAQVAVIAGTNAKFHKGRAYDEIPATLTREERVLTGAGARAIGGDRAVAAANRGQAPAAAAAPLVVNVLGHRAFDAQVHVAMRVPGSQLARAVASQSRRAR